LEEAIVSDMTHVGDLMVRTPVVAYGWQHVADVRKAMLGNSFSAVPFRIEKSDNSEWQLLTDAGIVRMLNSASTTAERNRLLAMTIDSALEQERIEPQRAICCSPTDLIRAVVPQLNQLPILVIETE